MRLIRKRNMLVPYNVEGMDIRQEINSFWGRRNIAEMQTDVSDYLVKISGSDLRFALKMLENVDNALKEYKARLASVIQLRGAPKLPLVVVAANNQKEVCMGVIVRWQFGIPILEDQTCFILMNEEHRNRIYDEIKASDNTIRMLEQTNCKVVKHIEITEEYDRRLYHAEIVYLRDLSLSYRMKSRDDLSDTERVEYYLKGIPEKDYPYDKLDEGIVSALNDGGYNNIKVHSQLLLLSSELRDLKILYSNKPSSQIEFLVLPDYSSLHFMLGKTVKPFYLDWFVDIKNQFTFQNTHFTINIPLNNVNEYYSFMDGTKTLCSVQQFLKRP